MIRKFEVENFKSIKDKIEVSFVASNLREDVYYENTFDFKNEDILKVSAFYGANASGKSALVIAFAALRELVVTRSQPLPINGQYRLPYNPFHFSKEMRDKPTEFKIEFTLNNDNNSFLYVYSVRYNKDAVLFERFEKKTSQKTSLIYERRTINGTTSIDIGPSVNNPLLEALKPSVMVNRTFLSMFANFNVTDLTDAYKFFEERLINVTPEITRFSDYIPQEILRNDELKDFTLKLLKAADFNIKNLKVGKSKRRIKFSFGPTTQENDDALFLEHYGDVDDGSLEFIDESLGTKKMVVLAEILFPIFSKSSVLIVDELESSLHPELTKLIVELFLDDTINVNNSQLIFTSHETTLLNLNLLRRDQINFVYKDKQTCGTYIKSLSDFSVRKTDNVSKAYLAGRYLTTPDTDGDALRN